MKYLRGIKYVIHCLTSILSKYLFLSLKFVRKGQDIRSTVVNQFCFWMWPEFHIFLKIWIKEKSGYYRPESEMVQFSFCLLKIKYLIAKMNKSFCLDLCSSNLR